MAGITALFTLVTTTFQNFSERDGDEAAFFIITPRQICILSAKRWEKRQFNLKRNALLEPHHTGEEQQGFHIK